MLAQSGSHAARLPRPSSKFGTSFRRRRDAFSPPNEQAQDKGHQGSMSSYVGVLAAWVTPFGSIGFGTKEGLDA